MQGLTFGSHLSNHSVYRAVMGISMKNIKGNLADYLWRRRFHERVDRDDTGLKEPLLEYKEAKMHLILS